MKLTYSKADELTNAYNLLPFKGDAILDAVTNIIKLKPHIDAILTTKEKLINQYTNGKTTISNDHKNWAKFLEDFNKNLAKEVVIEDLVKISKKDLDLNRPSNVNLQSFIVLLKGLELLD